MTEIQQMMSDHVGNWWHRFKCCILNTKEVRSSNKLLKTLKWSCNRWILVRNPDTPKEFVQFVHEVRPFFAVTLSTLSHMLCGLNDDTMPIFNIFRIHFVVIFNSTVIYLSNQLGKWPKNNKWCQNMLEIDDVALNAAYWTQKKSGVQISLKNIEVAV